MKKILLVLLAASTPCFADVTATLTMEKASALELRYDLPDGCKALTFQNQGIRPHVAAAMRKDWTVLDNCAELDGSGIKLKGQSCTSVRIRVPASEQDLDRIYPWAYPMGGAMFSHTSAFAVQPTCGAVRWTFEAPGGRVVLEGASRGSRESRAATHPQIDYAPLVFMEGAAAPGEVAGQRFDARFSPAATVALQQSLEAIYGNYRRTLPGLVFPQPFLVAFTSPARGQMRGDVANRNTMRLMMPATSSAVEQVEANYLIAHEAAHVVQPAEIQDQWQSETTMIKEGGAEFMSWLSGVQLGWSKRADAAARMEKALNACLMAVGDAKWGRFQDRNWAKTPYHCGMTFHVLGLADSSAKIPAPLLLRDYYRDAGLGKRTDFARALECGATSACSPRWLPRFLGPDEKFSTVMAQYSKQTGLLVPAASLTRDQVAIVARKMLAALMAHDCGGQVSFYTEPEQFLIAQVTRCNSLREGMKLVSAEGASLFTDPASITRLVQACHGAGKVTLGLTEGAKVDVSCDKIIPPMPSLYTLDAGKLYSRLGIGNPRKAGK